MARNARPFLKTVGESLDSDARRTLDDLRRQLVQHVAAQVPDARLVPAQVPDRLPAVVAAFIFRDTSFDNRRRRRSP